MSSPHQPAGWARCQSCLLQRRRYPVL